MEEKRSVEHYRDHEIVCVVKPGEEGWVYVVSVVFHRGDDSEVEREISDRHYRSEVDALVAAKGRGRQLIDEKLG